MKVDASPGMTRRELRDRVSESLYRSGVGSSKAASEEWTKRMIDGLDELGVLALSQTRLYTVTVESEELSADWIDTYYIAARTIEDAQAVGERQLQGERPMAQIKGSEVYEYRGTGVIGRFQPDEDD